LTSRIPGFYRLPPHERLRALRDHHALTPADRDIYASEGLGLDAADVMVENVISTFRLPNAVACNLTIDGEDRLVPMVVEEPSVVAAVSNMARAVRRSGGFRVDVDRSVMIGQIQLPAVRDPARVAEQLRAAFPELTALGAGVHPRLTERGGGLIGFEVRVLRYDEPGRPAEDMVVLHALLDCVDAMGANMINTLCEHLSPRVEAIAGTPVGLRILSNLADRRLARATCVMAFDHLGKDRVEGAQIAEGIASAWRFAWADPYRAATHNKGVMNGIDAVALATGNDWRAIEAGAHAFAARDGAYRPLTRWEVRDSALYGSIEVPLQVGTVGGPIRVHPTVQANLRLMRCAGARDLAGVMAAVGLAQNLGALRALASEGIQAGHMRMHARTVAATAGAVGDEVPRVTAALVEARDFSVERALAVLTELRRA
jgi:hydroxymethylglutaryl-CoA reductase